MAMKNTKQKRAKQSRPIAVIMLLVCALACLLASSNTFLGIKQKNYEPSSGGYCNSGSEWQLVLVNKWNPAPANYQVEFVELSNGQLVDKRIYPALQDMFDSARQNGTYPIVVSGYRTKADQKALLDKKISQYMASGYTKKDAEAAAKEWVAKPGESEHQLGIAVDINSDGNRSTGEEVYQWLEENAWKFGFIRRYPPGKSSLTGVNSERWHYRYVGEEAALAIYGNQLCLEEYLDAR